MTGGPVPESAIQVILVDADDQALGFCDKLEAHRRGVLHRAVSLFAFNSAGELLVQQRAPGKYHSGGLWSNTACTHPRAGETLEQAVERGMIEELGVAPSEVRAAFPFTYRADVGNGLVEHEYDHVFIGRVADVVYPVPGEVSATAFRPVDSLERDMTREPELFTPWFRLLLGPVRAWVAAHREP